MTEPPVIEQARDLLHQFRLAGPLRAQREAAAASRRKTARAAADAALYHARTTAPVKLAEARQAQQTAEPLLTPVGRQTLQTSRPAGSIPVTNGIAPGEELSRRVSVATESLARIQSGLVELTRQRAQRARRQRRFAFLTLIAALALAGAVVWGLQPCGWADARLGGRSGCVRIVSQETTGGRSLAFAPHGQQFATGSQSQLVGLFDWPSGQAKQYMGSSLNNIETIRFAADGQAVGAANVYRGAKVWDVASGRELRALADGRDHSRVALSPDLQRLAAVNTSGGTKTLSIVEIASSREVHKFTRSGYEVGVLQFSPDGRLLAVGEGPSGGNRLIANTVTIYDLAANREFYRQTFDTKPSSYGPVNSIAFSSDGQTMAATNHNSVVVWNVLSGQIAAKWDTVSYPHSLAFAADGQTLAWVDYKTIKVWQLPAGPELRAMDIEGPIDLERIRGSVYINSLRFAPDGQTLLTRGADGPIREWRAR